jgi:hypothetical protein
MPNPVVGGRIIMDLTVAGCEDVEGIESSAGFSAVVSETMGFKKSGDVLPPAAELFLLEVCGFCDL